MIPRAARFPPSLLVFNSDFHSDSDFHFRLRLRLSLSWASQQDVRYEFSKSPCRSLNLVCFCSRRRSVRRRPQSDYCRWRCFRAGWLVGRKWRRRRLNKSPLELSAELNFFFFFSFRSLLPLPVPPPPSPSAATCARLHYICDPSSHLFNSHPSGPTAAAAARFVASPSPD